MMEVARSGYLPPAAASSVSSPRADVIRSGRCSATSLVASLPSTSRVRSVRDTAAALDATAGAEIGDPYAAPSAPDFIWLPPNGSRKNSASPLPQNVFLVKHLIQNAKQRRKPRRSFARTWGIGSRKVCHQCHQATSVQTLIWAAGLAMVIDFVAKAAGKTPAREEFEGLTWSLYQIGKTVSAAQYQLCWVSMQALSRQVAAWQQAYDVWITPVLATPPMKIGTINLEETDLIKGWAPIAAYVPFTALQNITGQPAINLPLAWSKSGLPIGVQFVGRFGEEQVLLSLQRRSKGLSPGAGGARRSPADIPTRCGENGCMFRARPRARLGYLRPDAAAAGRCQYPVTYSERTGGQENDMPDRSTQPRLDVTRISPDLYKAMATLEKYVEASGLEQKLLDLVKIRASQINGCAYCIVMHTNDARKHGESDEWMHLLNAWPEAPIYSARERAALAWTEAVTKISDHHVPDVEVYDEARHHFSEKELIDLTAAVIAINAWNLGRDCISCHTAVEERKTRGLIDKQPGLALPLASIRTAGRLRRPFVLVFFKGSVCSGRLLFGALSRG